MEYESSKVITNLIFATFRIDKDKHRKTSLRSDGLKDQKQLKHFFSVLGNAYAHNYTMPLLDCHVLLSRHRKLPFCLNTYIPNKRTRRAYNRNRREGEESIFTKRTIQWLRSTCLVSLWIKTKILRKCTEINSYNIIKFPFWIAFSVTG